MYAITVAMTPTITAHQLEITEICKSAKSIDRVRTASHLNHTQKGWFRR